MMFHVTFRLDAQQQYEGAQASLVLATVALVPVLISYVGGVVDGASLIPAECVPIRLDLQ